MTTDVLLGRGVIDAEGHRHRDAALAPPDGWLELALADAVPAGDAPTLLAPDLRQRLLAVCLDRLGGYHQPDADIVAGLSRGDADQLAYAVRREMMGPSLTLVLRCANPSCGQLADVDLPLEDLLADTTEPEPEWFVATAAGGGSIVLRAATGRDDRALGATSGTADELTAALMARLVRTVTLADGQVTEGIGPEDWPGLSAPLRHAALLALADEPIAPVTDVQAGCPSCEALLEVHLDPLVLLARELGGHGERLVIETHCLAYHYGWTEEQVLALPRRRRWRYLSLLRAQVVGASLESEAFRA